MENKDANVSTENVTENTVEGIPVTREADVPKKKKKGKAGKTILKIILWVVVIAAIIVLTLFLTAKIAPEFETIADVISWIRDQF